MTFRLEAQVHWTPLVSDFAVDVCGHFGYMIHALCAVISLPKVDRNCLRILDKSDFYRNPLEILSCVIETCLYEFVAIALGWLPSQYM